MSALDRLRLEHPVVQAGMGGGISDGRLAGAVAAAGGLGSVGILAPRLLLDELGRARELAAGGTVAANLLTPFTTRAHVEACAAARVRVVVLHGGSRRRLLGELKDRGLLALQTVGTPEEARRALAEGADGLVVQGIEAGGHLVGVEPALDAVARIRPLAREVPLLAAGGIATHEDVRRALAAGADAAVAGTRFLLTDECAAHPLYKLAVLGAERTLETRLFGLAWPMRHRVVPNAATERWCRTDPRGRLALRALHWLSMPLARLPLSLTARLIYLQRTRVPLFGPGAPLQGMPDHLVDSAALYAGETALRIDSILPAAEAVASLAHGASRAGAQAAPPAGAPQSPTIRSP